MWGKNVVTMTLHEDAKGLFAASEWLREIRRELDLTHDAMFSETAPLDAHRRALRAAWCEGQPRFAFGLVVMTGGALVAAMKSGASLVSALFLHGVLDPGELDAEDQASNIEALAVGERIVSAINLPTTDPTQTMRVYVITEWDRSRTTILLPEEY